MDKINSYKFCQVHWRHNQNYFVLFTTIQIWYRRYFSFHIVVGGLAVSMSDCEVIVQGSILGQPMFL